MLPAPAVVDVPAVFATRVQHIVASGHGPVLLPGRLATEQPRLVPAGGSTPGGWVLVLRASRTCGGTSICSSARFSGVRGGVPAGPVRVALAKGRRGWFTPTRCATYCAPPQIQWRERGLRYTFAVTAGRLATERRTIVRLANAAIAHGPRR